MATLTIKTVDLDDPDPALVAAAAGGDQFLGTKQTLLIVKNDDVSSMNVTLTSQVSDAPGVTAADIVEAVPAGEARTFAFGSNITRFKDVDGYVQVAYSAVTSVTVGVILLDN